MPISDLRLGEGEGSHLGAPRPSATSCAESGTASGCRVGSSGSPGNCLQPRPQEKRCIGHANVTGPARKSTQEVADEVRELIDV